MNPWLMLAGGLLLGTLFGVLIMSLLRAVGQADEDDLADTLLLDAIQRNHWQIGYLNDRFALLGDTPPRILGGPNDDVRTVIASAMETEHAEER